MLEEKLKICATCNAIEITEGIWLNEKALPELYQKYIEEYEGRLNHGYCPECGGKAKEEAERFIQQSRNRRKESG